MRRLAIALAGLSLPARGDAQPVTRPPAMAVAEPAAKTAPAPPADLKPEVRIQRRFVEKKHRFAAYAGFAYLGRGDFYTSPGAEVAVSFYPIERLGLDLRGAWFFSSPSSELLYVTRRTGLVPDSHPSKAAVMLGARLSLGYAKMRLSSRRVLHFEPQVFLYGGVHVASGLFAGTAVGPMAEVGLGFLVFATRWLQARLDAGVTIGGEQRTAYEVVVGGYPVLSLGVMF